MIINALSCEQVDVQEAIDESVSGDTVIVPAGACTWGDNKSYISVNKDIILQGAGQGQTVITLSDTAREWTTAVIRIRAFAVVKSMTIYGSNVKHVAAFSVSTVNNWRITDIEFIGGTVSAYFAYIGNVYGLIDNNNITGNSGSSELIFARGPIDSWQTPHSIGGADNVFIENNTFNGQGYVCDINANGRAVVRYNTIHGSMKIDGHGKCSNTPPRGVRHMEVYNNVWTANNRNTKIEIRGGTGVIFNNHRDYSIGTGLQLREYSAFQTCGSFGGVCQCPEDYPIDDQIGVGIDPKVAASEPLYLWNNTQLVGNDLWPASIKDDAIPGVCVSCGYTTFAQIILEGRDYFESTTKPAAMADYVPYPYPHPLTSGEPECASNDDCLDICIGVDLYSQKCVNGICVADNLIEANSLQCEYIEPDPCEGVECDDICIGVDLYSQICIDGICEPDVLLETNSLQCEYIPPEPSDSSSSYLIIGGIGLALLSMLSKKQ